MTTAEHFYHSIYQQPILLVAGNLVLFIYAWLKKIKLTRTSIFFIILSISDAILTTKPWHQLITLFFVWAGDYRVYYTLAMNRLKSKEHLFLFTASLLPSLLTPLVLSLINNANLHSLFLTYEILFLLTYGLTLLIFKPLKINFYFKLPLFYYLIWITADLGILFWPLPFGAQWILRSLANFLYYVAWNTVYALSFLPPRIFCPVQKR
jgi:hypothetical protein